MKKKTGDKTKDIKLMKVSLNKHIFNTLGVRRYHYITHTQTNRKSITKKVTSNFHLIVIAWV